ncbi:mitochondrial pyruvate carrier 4-like [Ziziphus jujuba]|uniref:Mitochondrial pyruvate carrier n=1 Tax=Ziziphus jujuba TaxID=326968 RepID=A0A6P6G3Y5_ZIZJJ|nr:mitochondrial pyruvate carrier 4-like [Ziziphus jujuba]
MAPSKLEAFWNQPAGPKTIHFWAPCAKWGVTITNILGFSNPPEKVSYPQQTALTCNGLVWARYSTIITPKNWNLFSVSVGTSAIAICQLGRKIQHDFFSKYDQVQAVPED